MGEHEGWSQPQPSDGPLPNGLLPNEASSVIRVLDSDQWLKAEERAAELIACIQPNPPSEERRNAVADYVQRLIMKCFPCQVFTFGSVPLKTYLPDGDIDLSAFSENQSLKESWAHQVRDMLENEEKNENAEFRVKEVQCIQAEVKIIKCLVENIVVDISFDQLGGLCTLCFLEEVDNLISQNHLFKRSIILIKAWCYYESRILGAHHGLISTYALETLVLYIFHVFNNSFAGPLEVLYHFLEFFSKFDWDNFCVSLRGPVPISSLPDVTAETPIKDGGELLLRKPFLDACTAVYAVFPNGQENQGRPFASKHFNVIDPLRINNNLGRSVSKGNFFRIRSAFAFGAKKLARLLDCPKEDLYYEVNQFFMNTWDRHGSGHRLDAARNDLWRSRQSNADHLSETENLKNNLKSKKCDTSSTRESHGDGKQHAPSQSLINGNSYNARTSEQSTRDIGSNQDVHDGKGQRSCRPDNLVSGIQGRYLFGFARTHSSPELTDTYGEASSEGRCARAPHGSKNQIAFARSDHGMRKNVESDSFPSQSIRSPTADSSSVRHNSSHQSLDVSADSSSVSTSYNEDLGQGVMAEEFVNALGTQKMQLEEQNLVNMMASPTAHHYSGQMHVPLNSAPCHLPFPLPPSILASMGYAQRNFGGLVPPNIPLIESSLRTNVQFSQGFVPSQLTNYFPGIGMASNPEDSTESGNETYDSVEMNLGEGDHDFWHEQESGSTGGFNLDNGNFEMHQSNDKQHSTSASYDFVPSSQLDNSGNSTRVQRKIIRETQGSMREDHPDNFQHAENRGNEVYFNDRTVSSRSFANVHTSTTRSKTSSESSREGSSVKMSKSMRERRGRRPTANDLQSAVYGKGRSVSEHSSPYGEDETRECNAQLTIGSEMAERNAGPLSVSSLHVPRDKISGFGQAQTSGSDSLIPIAPMLLGPGSHQRTMDNSGGFPFAFYPTGPPVPFVTMLPLYNFPSETCTSDSSKSHIDGEEGLDNSDSRNNFDSSKGIDQPEVVSPSSSIRGAASVEPPEHKSDILNSDFASHWQNLQYARFCQNSHSPAPSIYPSPVVVPPVYLQGHFPWDGPGRPVSSNMNLFTQLMNYGPRLVPVPPLQPVFNRPAGVYQRYGDEIPRHRSGTGTYLPNPKMSVRERHSSNARRGNYSYERSEHHGDREGSWNTNLKSRPAGHRQNRNQAEKPSSRPERLTSESWPDRSWASHRHETHSSYQSQTSPIRPNSQSGSANVAYGTYPNPGAVSSNGPTIPSVVMLYPYDHNASYGSSAEQLEFGSFGPVGFSSVNEVSQLSEANQLGGTYEELRFRGSSAERSSPDQPSPPHLQRGI